MTTLSHILIAAFGALDSADRDQMRDTVECLAAMRDGNVTDVWVTDAAVAAIEGELEVRLENLFQDGYMEEMAAYDPVTEAIRAYRI